MLMGSNPYEDIDLDLGEQHDMHDTTSAGHNNVAMHEHTNHIYGPPTYDYVTPTTEEDTTTKF